MLCPLSQITTDRQRHAARRAACQDRGRRRQRDVGPGAKGSAEGGACMQRAGVQQDAGSLPSLRDCAQEQQALVHRHQCQCACRPAGWAACCRTATCTGWAHLASYLPGNNSMLLVAPAATVLPQGATAMGQTDWFSLFGKWVVSHADAHACFCSQHKSWWERPCTSPALPLMLAPVHLPCRQSPCRAC